MKNVRLLVDAEIDYSFINGAVDSLAFNSFNKEIFLISSGGYNYVSLLKLFSKKHYELDLDYLKNILNIIKKNDPYFFLSLTEEKAGTKNKALPSYFFLNEKDKNYQVKLIQASLSNKNKPIIINGNSYYSSTFTDTLPIYPLTSDYSKFLGLYIVKEKNYNKLKKIIKMQNSPAVVIVDSSDDYNQGVQLTSRTLKEIIKPLKLLRRFKDLDNTIFTLYDKDTEINNEKGIFLWK